MLFNKSKQIAFLLIPRCGSTSLREFLLQHEFKFPIVFSDVQNEVLWHPTYKQAVKQHPNLINYKIFAFVRDPISRFESALKYAAKELDLKIEKQTDYDNLIEKLFGWDNSKKLTGVYKEIFKSQSEWTKYENVCVLKFLEMPIVVKEILGSNAEFPKLNYSSCETKLSFNAKDFCLNKYHEDFALYERIK